MKRKIPNELSQFQCSKCKCFKDKDSFYKNRKVFNGIYSSCRDCEHKAQSNWRKSNRIKLSIYSKTWREANKEKRRDHLLKNLYNTSTEKINKLLREQDYKCAICKTATPKGAGWHIDHDHRTMKVRGILCISCNTQLPIVEDKDKLTAALKYLKINEMDLNEH